MGIIVLIWNDNLAVEKPRVQRFTLGGNSGSITIAIDERGEDSIRDSVASKLGKNPSEVGNITTWADSKEFRLAIGASANSQKWYKRIELRRGPGENSY